MPTTIPLPFSLGSKGWTISAQGWGGSTSHVKSHFATDFTLAKGASVIALARGVVVSIRENVKDGASASNGSKDPSNGPSDIGNYITVYYPSLGIYATYAHLGYNSVIPKVNDQVSAGQVLGQVGNTGWREGTHLHFFIGTGTVSWTTGIVADAHRTSTPPAFYDTATGEIAVGVVSQVTFDLNSVSLKSDQHNLTLVGSSNVAGYGDSRSNLISGNSGANLIDGRAGNDQLFGGSGADTLRGGDGSDSLNGGAGRDLITGGGDADQLTGGADADRFVYTAAGDSTLAKYDVVRDFSRSQGDRFDLSGIDANSTSKGDQAFTWIGAASFHGRPGELHMVNGFIEGDINGDGRADFRIQVQGWSSLMAQDFFL